MLPQKLVIASEALILLAYKVSSKTCNSSQALGFIRDAVLPQNLVIALEAQDLHTTHTRLTLDLHKICKLLQNLLKNLQ